MTAGTDKFKKSSHYCKTPLIKWENRLWACGDCGATYRCKLIKGRLAWLQTSNGRK